MSFDGLMLHSITKELNEKLLNGRVTKINHPYNHDIILTIRSDRKNYQLLLSAHSIYSRCHLTQVPFVNPQTPSTFCMNLRKYLDGAFLIDIEQYQNDRICFFVFSKRDELGDKQNIILSIEIMGKHSNIILFNQSTSKIIDCIKHIPPYQNSYRTLLPGSIYQLPPKKEQINPFDFNDEDVFKFLSINQSFNVKQLQTTFQGFGKDSAQELAFLLNNNLSDKTKIFKNFINNFNNVEPNITLDNNKYLLLPFKFQSSLGQIFMTNSSMSKICDTYFEEIVEKDRVKQQIGDILNNLQNQKQKLLKKIPKLKQNLTDAQNSEIIREKGELLTTYAHEVKKGSSKVILNNYYTNEDITITLDPSLSVHKNAQKYFQKYQKLKQSVKFTIEQIDKTEQEIDYLDTLITEIELAKPVDLPIIKEELIKMGYLKNKSHSHRNKENTKFTPRKYISSDGTNILVGKNNLQNDELTLKKSNKNYIWLHTQNIPGSHVVINSDNPSQNTLEEAAKIAAYFSKYRHSAKVPVDYVQIKYINKPKGAKPGFVIYKNQKTLFVTPDEQEIANLKFDK